MSKFGRFAMLLVLLLGAMGMWATPAAAQEEHGSDAMARLSAKTGQEFEMDFMSAMIGHHQEAIDMAEMALDHAVHKEIRDLAALIITDQTREVGEMTTWLMQWYNMEPMKDVMVDEEMAMLMGSMGQLSGDNFDKMFLATMHEHHRNAIMMAELVADRATHAELKTVAQNIMTSQEAEVLQMMDWAMMWYNLDLMTVTPHELLAAMGSGPVGMPRTGDGILLGWQTLLLLLGVSMMSGGVLARRYVTIK